MCVEYLKINNNISKDECFIVLENMFLIIRANHNLYYS